MLAITNPRRFALFIVGVVIILIVGAWWVWGEGSVQKSGEVKIEAGDSAGVVWARLVEGGFTSRRLPWRYQAWRQGAAGQLKAGTYQIERGETVAAVVQRMVEGDVVPDELTLTYPEGFSLEQMAARTAARQIGTVEEFMAAAFPEPYRARYSWLNDVPAGRTLEGYLFPDTYRVFEDDAPRDVVARMLTTFDATLTTELRAEAAAAGRTLDDVVIMASIVEREVLTDGDMAVVAGILWKRFDEGVGLDADATIRYALKKWDGVLTVEDLHVDSPYNTRRYRGLPPGPISNPGLRALTAAVRPQSSEFYYYLSAPDGKTYFGRTNDEHNVNKAKYLR